MIAMWRRSFPARRCRRREPRASRQRGTVRLLACAAAIGFGLLAACGDSPTDPGAGAQAEVDVAGDWSGTWTFNAAGLSISDPVTVSLSQSGAAVTGSWSAQSGASGQIRFNATRQVTGTLTINQLLLGSVSCNGATTIQGTAAAARIDVTIAAIPPQGVCQWGTGNRFVLTR